MMHARIVNMSWASRICAVLFGKRRVVEFDGIRLYVSLWRGVLYILYVRRLTPLPPDR